MGNRTNSQAKTPTLNRQIIILNLWRGQSLARLNRAGHQLDGEFDILPSSTAPPPNVGPYPQYPPLHPQHSIHSTHGTVTALTSAPAEPPYSDSAYPAPTHHSPHCRFLPPPPRSTTISARLPNSISLEDLKKTMCMRYFPRVEYRTSYIREYFVYPLRRSTQLLSWVYHHFSRYGSA